MDDSLKCVASEGGPLAIIAEKDLQKWVGCFGKISVQTGAIQWEKDLAYPEKTHYDTVCEFEGLVGVVVVDGIQVIVLGDEPATTAWYPFLDRQGGLLIGWIYANEMEAVEKLLKQIPAQGWRYETEVDIDSAELMLFDSASLGTEIHESIKLLLIPGRYEISSLEYQPDDQTHFRLHRIIK